VGVDPYNAGVLANELVELVRIADGDVFLAESLGQQRFDDTQALRDILCLPIKVSALSAQSTLNTEA
jgi:hypothetical protein